MKQSIGQAAILGAGTMGAQIAAHFANVDIPVLLLDLPADNSDRNRISREALERLSRVKPSPFYTPDKAQLITAGNFEDDLPRLTSCQWIIEAVIEQLDVKKELWARVEDHRHAGSIVSTNTSGLSVNEIAEGRRTEFKKHWLGTHFFNPPRYMKLLEIIPAEETEPSVLESVRFLGERVLGKGTVLAKDTPNFIANRIGSFVLMRTFDLMNDLGLSIEEVDALTGPMIGWPKTATFHLADLVGIDVIALVAANLHQNAIDDPWREHFRTPDWIDEVVKRGWLGRKSGQGFYKKQGSQLLVLDPETFEYREQHPPEFASPQELRSISATSERIAAIVRRDDRAGQFIWRLLSEIFLYSAERIPEIADHHYQVDRAMKWGFNWELGPFELWQSLGVEKISSRLKAEGREVPDWISQVLASSPQRFYLVGPTEELYFDIGAGDYAESPKEPEKLSLAVFKARDKIIDSTSSASLIDIGEGTACLEFTGKLNTIDDQVIDFVTSSLERLEKSFLGLVIGNQGNDFCVGANLKFLAGAIEEKKWGQIDRSIRSFQQMTSTLRSWSRPVVAAPFRRVLGGGVEVCLGTDAAVASAETYMGLVEVGAGLIPAGGGCKEMVIRYLAGAGDDLAHQSELIKQAFEMIATARVSSSALEAQRLRYLKRSDVIEIHPDRLLHRARQQVLNLADLGYVPSAPRNDIPALGASALAALKVRIHLMKSGGYISEYDALIASKLALVLAGGDLNHTTRVSEEHFLNLEREAFLSLCGEERTLQRIHHLLKTGKPLRN